MAPKVDVAHIKPIRDARAFTCSKLSMTQASLFTMVGVPGKSKGCGTCRKRKIKCDEGKPTCNNCAKSNRTCGGYQREQKFVPHEGARAVTRPREASSPSRSPSSNSEYDPHILLASGIPHAIVSDCESLFTDPFRDYAKLDAYFFESFMRSLEPQEDYTSVHAHNWLLATYETWPQGTVRLALRALSIARVGRHRRIKPLRYLGREIYAQALRALYADLDSPPEIAFTLPTASACRLLGCYEMFGPEAESKGHWGTHVAGFAEVVQRGGSATFRRELDEGILLGVRRIFSAWALNGRKETSLGGIGWKPSESSPRYLEELLSFAGLQLATLLANLDGVINFESRSVHAPAATIRTLLDGLFSLEQALQDWYRNYTARNSGGHNFPLYWEDANFYDPHISETVGLSFRSLDIAHQVINYWTLQLILSLNVAAVCSTLDLLKVQQRPDTVHAFFNDALPAAYTQRASVVHLPQKRTALANTIIRGTDYTTQESRDIEHLYVSKMPLDIATTELEKQNPASPELRRGRRNQLRISQNMRAAKE